MRKNGWVLVGLLALCGCKVGPNYKEPDLTMPTVFEGQADSIQDQELCCWWKAFQDPLLDSFIDEAVIANFDLRIAAEKIVQARAEYRIQGSFLFPEIDLSAAATRSRYSQNVFTEGANAASISSGNESGITRGAFLQQPVQNLFQIGFDAVWELDFWGKFRRDKKASFDEWQASGWQAQEVLLLTISEVVRDYVSIRSLQQQKERLQKKIAADLRGLSLAKDLFTAGLSDEILVDEWQALTERDQASLPIVETSLKQAIYALAVLLGKLPEGFSSHFDEVKDLPVYAGKIPAGLPSELLRRRPDIRAQERILAAATERIGVAVADLFPHIFLTGNGIGYESDKARNLLASGSRYWTIGPSISWSILNFGRVKGEIAVANSLQKQALLAYEQTVNNALQDVEGSLVAYFEEEKRNKHLGQQEKAYEKTWMLTKDLLQAGLASELQVLQTYTQVLDAEISWIQSSEAKLSDLVALYKAMGGDWECLSTL